MRLWSGLLFSTLSLLLVLVGSAFAPAPRSLNPAPQADSEPPGPDRYTAIAIDYTEYTWWMAKWGNNQIVCEIITDHEGMPTLGDVYTDCEETVYEQWFNQDPCIKANVNECQGYYLFLASSRPAQKEVAVKLPAPLVQVALEGCNPVYSSSTNICESEPILVLTGQEPLPDHQIIAIDGTYDGQAWNCPSSTCRLKLVPTDEDGITLQFWAYSSYGDSSEIFTAQVRVAQTNAGNPDQNFWYVDVLSSQWAGVPVATCVESWGAFPPVGGPPPWLSTPVSIEALNSDLPYNYLATNLINQGVVDVSNCPDAGLSPDGTASTCGLETARPAINEWQDQFDSLIFSVAQQTGVPAQLLKNLFARESQFWPGVIRASDVGLGQLTENGADTTLLWNPAFFYQFCPLVMDSEKCSEGYLNLSDEEQNLVRLSLIASVNATCENCPLGINLDQANYSVAVFAHTLLANCEQAGRIVRNVSGGVPGEAASYEDLWKFTLVNYNAGPGCLGDALDVTNGEGKPLNWENVSPYLIGACQGAVNYVNDISK